jgi:hypothetical protein
VSEMIASVVYEEIWPIRDKQWYLELWVKWRYHLQHAHGCCASASVSLCHQLRWQVKAKSTHEHTWIWFCLLAQVNIWNCSLHWPAHSTCLS